MRIRCPEWAEQAAASHSMSGVTSGISGAVEDEFAVPADRRQYLESSKQQIERLFQVVFTVLGALDHFPVGSGESSQSSEWIWLKLKGTKEAVRKAKEYVKGLCEPDLEKKEHYPKDMHCIFVGAQRLFLNCLIQATCADVAVLDTGVLSIKGDIAAVVMAQSCIQQFVTLFENNESLPSPKESEVKKKYKYFVERHADKYTMDLLLLPSALKEELLNLVQDDRCLETEAIVGLQSCKVPNRQLQKASSNAEHTTFLEESRKQAGTPVTELTKQMDSVLSESSEQHFIPINNVTPPQDPASSKGRPSCKRRISETEDRHVKKQFSLENAQESRPTTFNSTLNSGGFIDLSDNSVKRDDSIILIRDTDDDDDVNEEMEYKILVDFFRTMGYSQEIVVKVIGEMGQSEEPLKLLEKIEKEYKKLQDKTTLTSCNSNYCAVQLNSGAKTNISQLRKETAVASGKLSESGCRLDQPVKERKDQKLQKTADSQCVPAKTEEKKLSSISIVASKDCTNKTRLKCSQPGHNSSSTEDLDTDGGMLSGHTVQKLVLDKHMLQDHDFIARGSSDPPPPHKPVMKETLILQQKSAEGPVQQNKNPICHNQAGHSPPCRPAPCSNNSVQKPAPIPALGFDINSGKTFSNHIDVSVTGVQRFLNSLKIPYRLELKNEPGRTDLKHIIVDGSNVAMSHGLNKFFSCRGIAIAVAYFWRNGHRNITVFVPQWRTKRDPNITEQRFLTELQDLGILSFTPARTVLGTRIASHDDRFLLHLAEKTGGIIVTNDNFKEFVIESPVWREIIKERLLQYTFAGDIFMIPDDPLGRHGPKLEDFLCKQPSIRNFPKLHFHQQGEKLNPLRPFSDMSAAMPTNVELRPGVGPPQGDTVSQWTPNIQRGLTVPPPRSFSETSHLKEELLRIFPEAQQRQKINEILTAHPYMRDLNALSAMVLD
ncbi:NEDD4-binding protein 1 [Microcaecilia unicolor]|uniref:NEDD4-binding protein 1 n=1 Tax=Microcaecilia unicolor TaxID=1415580 RepID=A0A6P7Y5K2_9AMPH|nr:NEDD4-binding protein 1 [Microcaecilia unicolor]